MREKNEEIKIDVVKQKSPSKKEAIEKVQENNISSYTTSNFISKFFFFWAFLVLLIPKNVKINYSQIGPLNKKDDAHTFSSFIAYYWEQLNYKSIKNNALFKTLLRANIIRFLILLIMNLIISLSDYLSVLLLKNIIDYFENKEIKILNVEYSIHQLGIIFLFCQIISTIFSIHFQNQKTTLGIRAGFELNCFIFQKILKVYPSIFNEKTTQGEILSLIQFDSTKFNWTLQTATNIIIYPLFIISYIYLLFSFFGLAFLGGLLTLSICILINFRIFKSYRDIEIEIMEKTDQRMKITTEIFNNIKGIKINNWENFFLEKISKIRGKEVDSIKKEMNLTSLSLSWYWFYPTLVAIVTIGIYQYFNDQFTISTMLMGLAIFSRLQEPIRDLPVAINGIISTIVSMNRIEKFIRQGERNENTIIKGNYDIKAQFAIKIENASFSWGNNAEIKNDIDSKPPFESQEMKESLLINVKKDTNTQEDFNCLEKINFVAKPGEIVGIIGEVGCGKTTLLEAIQNSLVLTNPTECQGIFINGKTAYISQNPWIQNTTIKDNILFFNEFDEKKYKESVEKSQLINDLNNLSGGDATEIGEKGINLSEGQKMRVSLARALYSNSDIYLFDDPMSCLDAETGKKIFENCIVKYLTGKTRILVTHDIQCLRLMDKIAFMKNKKISWFGSYPELIKQDFFDLFIRKSTSSSKKSGKSQNEILKSSNDKISKMTKEEDEEEGGVKFKIYKTYCSYFGGIKTFLCILLIMLLWQINKGGSDLWLAHWSKPENQKETPGENTKIKFFIIYCFLGIGGAFCMFLRLFLLSLGTSRLGRSLHNDMISNLLDAPINRFHDTIPRGQIFNRFSKDLYSIMIFMYIIGDWLVSSFSVLGSIAICSIFDIYSLSVLPIILVIGYIMTSYYLIGSRKLIRLEGNSHSPILNTINETIPGVTSISSFGKKLNFLEKFYSNINNSYKTKIYLHGLYNWFNLQFSIIALFYIGYLVFLTIFYENNFTSQSVGIMFSYSVILQKNIGYFFIASSEIENKMISMERCVKYTNIKTEKSKKLEIDDKLMKRNWAKEGKIKFENYSVRYRPNTDIVLKNINFEILQGEKIGIVGRTGSGKSTISLSLLRILEPLSGSIYIDNQDISLIGLNLLRTKITLIPQEPVILEGTIKYNVDPFNKATNTEILNIFKEIGLDFNGSEILEKKISQNGENISSGEKQLIQLARGIIQNNQIIVLDEATSNIDYEKEEKIDKYLERIWKNKTILSISHRIKPMMKYNKILVLDYGEVADFDSPSNLLKKEKSIFSQLFSKSFI